MPQQVDDGDGKPIEGRDTAGLFPNVMCSSELDLWVLAWQGGPEDAMFEPHDHSRYAQKWQDYQPKKERGKDSPVSQPVFYGELTLTVVVIRNLPPRSPQGLFARTRTTFRRADRRLIRPDRSKSGETSEDDDQNGCQGVQVRRVSFTRNGRAVNSKGRSCG